VTRRALATLVAGTEGVVTSVHGEERHRLLALGLSPGCRIRVLSRLPLGGPLVVGLEWGLLALDRNLAYAVRVSLTPARPSGRG
jgi:Fe2+ transport system protein FeoA